MGRLPQLDARGSCRPRPCAGRTRQRSLALSFRDAATQGEGRNAMTCPRGGWWFAWWRVGLDFRSGSSNGRSSRRMTTTQAVIGSVTPAIAATAGRKFIQSIFHSHPGRALWRMGSPCDTPKLIYQYIYSMSQGLFCRMIIFGFSCCNCLLIEEVFAPWMFYDCFGE